MNRNSTFTGPLTLSATIETWPLKKPFRITGRTRESLEVLLVCLEADGQQGRGEAAGVFYRNDVPDSMLRQVEHLRPAIEAGLTHETVQSLLPPGGARNALDCALWDLEAKLTGIPVWQRAGMDKPGPVLTTFTCGADTPEDMARTAAGYAMARAIKLKLTGEQIDAERVRAVRSARRDVWLGVDANQGFTRKSLEKLIPTLVESRVELIEQPLPIGEDADLETLQSPIPIAADESVQTLGDIQALVGRYSVVNIKLDKCGGLTHAFEMARAAHALGLQTMVGNMLGTSLAMAPSFLLGQLCGLTDLDGPIFLKDDRAVTVAYQDGLIVCPEALWGGAR